MDGSSVINYPANEQLVGKFHVTTVENLPVSTLNNHDDSIPQTSLITDEPGCPSRFQMIRVDRNFGRGRWKVNDYEPPENTLISTLPPVHTIENEPIHIGNNSTIPHIPAVIPGDLNPATLAITAPVTSVILNLSISFENSFFSRLLLPLQVDFNNNECHSIIHQL
jgi:hypothetical protein